MALARYGQLEDACHTVLDIQDDSLQVEVLGSLAAVVEPLGDVAYAEALVTEAWDKAKGIQRTGRGAWALRTLAVALAGLNRFDDAWEVVGSIDPGRDRVWALSLLAAGQARTQRKQEAEAMFAAAEAAAQDIKDDRERAEALRAVADGLAQAGQFERAKALAQRIQDETLREKALGSLSENLALSQQFDDAQAVALGIRYDYLRARVLEQFALTRAKNGEFRQSLAVLDIPALFIRTIAEWKPAFEQLGAGTTVSALCDVISMMVWVRPDWQSILTLLAVQ